METCIEYHDRDFAWVSSDERKWITRIRKLQKTYGDQIQVIAEPEQNDGCLYCKIPVSWIRIQPPRHINMSDDQRQALRDRLSNARAQKEKENT